MKSRSIALSFLLSLSFLFTNVMQAQSLPSFSETTVNTLSKQAPGLNKEVLRYALSAYKTAHNKGLAKKHYLTVIDYSKPSKEKRFWVIDLDNQKIKYATYVAHGKNSGNATSTRFSNTPNSKTSSIGVYVTKNGYIGKNGYSLRMQGLEKGVNDNAMKRAVVIHGSTYVSEGIAKSRGQVGRSWGCPAVPKPLSTNIINLIKNDSVVFAYYPHKKWLANSAYLKNSNLV